MLNINYPKIEKKEYQNLELNLNLLYYQQIKNNVRKHLKYNNNYNILKFINNL